MKDATREMKPSYPVQTANDEPRISPPQEPKSVSRSFRFAWEGVMFVLSTQRHMRTHLIIIGLVLAAAWGLGVSGSDWLHLLFAMALVLITEMFNTTVEASMDLLVDTYNPKAKVIKDVAAGTVLIASLYALAVAAIVFVGNKRLVAILGGLSALPPRPHLGAIQLVIIGGVVVALIIAGIKKRTGRGTFLRGGVVSGHTAVGFLVATSIVILTRDIAISALALALALLVSQSRMQARIHSPAEVIIGALVGTIVAAVIFLWPAG